MSVSSTKNPNGSSPRYWKGFLGIAGGVIIILSFIAWGFWPVEHKSTASSQQQFTLEVDFDKFRQIMVRKNATKAISAHSGMKLLDEQVGDFELEIPEQKRPLLNALLGQSRAKLSAQKQITVSLNDPYLDADHITLTQLADVQPDSMSVRTASTEPAGNLTKYTTELSASRLNAATTVTISIDQTVQLHVPRLFTSRADRQVQQAADKAIEEQHQAIRDFIAEHVNERIIMPDL